MTNTTTCSILPVGTPGRIDTSVSIWSTQISDDIRNLLIISTGLLGTILNVITL